MTAAIVIPARYGSTRFPGKPLLRDTGKYLIQHVVEQARLAKRAARVVVATDDERILEAVKSFETEVVMTSPTHPSGTDRLAEVVGLPSFSDVDVVVNVQGDEPEIDPELIDSLIAGMERTGVPMATVSCPFESIMDIHNPNMVKVVTDGQGQALYFSRSTIPFDRDGTLKDMKPSESPYRKHVGMYAYTKNALLTLSKTPVCGLETIEKLEQLRALYSGMKILVLPTDHAPHGIDTPDDYKAFLTRYNDSEKHPKR